MAQTALFSLHNTDQADVFARALVAGGWSIIASRETCILLSQKGIPVTDVGAFCGVSEEYGFPPTLHPKIEYALTSSSAGGPRIELVYVIPYPLSEGNDVGGRALLALAAKGGRVPVMCPDDMRLVAQEMEKGHDISPGLRSRLINKTYALIAGHYDDLLRERRAFDTIFARLSRELSGGENPYQSPAQLFSVKGDDALAIPGFRQLSGEAPCYTNLADLDSVLQTLSLSAEAFRLRGGKEPYLCVAAKHGNACGMGMSRADPAEAVEKALFGNPRAVWGGEVMVNFAVDERIARMLYKHDKRKELCGSDAWMLDVVCAPQVTPEAVDLLGGRQIRRIFENRHLVRPSVSKAAYSYRFVRGGLLRQPPHSYIFDPGKAECTGSVPDEPVIESLIMAWAVAWSSYHGGNEVAVVKDAKLLGAGGGPSTVDAASLALARAGSSGESLNGAVFAADAFFPFRDAPEKLCGQGLCAGVVPGGGKAFAAVRDFFQEKGVSMFYLPEEYRGFCRH
ncbi:MAG: hypothetical protein MJA29_14390 [Candidatus Omnitrophica bacterium]|nr:hypothetical protein [Candidatus Omnitrophota bacterium]